MVWTFDNFNKACKTPKSSDIFTTSDDDFNEFIKESYSDLSDIIDEIIGVKKTDSNDMDALVNKVDNLKLGAVQTSTPVAGEMAVSSSVVPKIRVDASFLCQSSPQLKYPTKERKILKGEDTCEADDVVELIDEHADKSDSFDEFDAQIDNPVNFFDRVKKRLDNS